MESCQRGFVVEEIDMGRPSILKQVDDLTRLRGCMREIRQTRMNRRGNCLVLSKKLA